MEEENRKGPGIFYAVVSVATLVVAIIGATFAYFSSQISAQDNKQLTGNTLNIGGEEAAVKLTVEKLTFTKAQAGSNDLVPATFTNEPTSFATTDATQALTNNCEKNGYTGCHLWKLTVTNTSKLATANLKLNLTAQATVKTDWSYAVFTATSDEVEDYSTLSPSEVTSQGAFGPEIAAASETELEPDTHVYYVLIYLHDDGEQQDAGNENDATGSYTGVATLEIASGQNVSTSFSAAA